MKNKLLLATSLSILALGFATPISVYAQSCAIGDPIKPFSLAFNSRSGTATLIGFGEYTTPSAPPKKYLTYTASGTASSAAGFTSDCSSVASAQTVALSGSASFNPVDGSFTNATSLIITVDGSVTFSGTFDPPEAGSSPVGDCRVEWICDRTTLFGPATGACCITSQGSVKHGGHHLHTLSDEDTEDNAEARAPVTLGSSNLVFREVRTSGFSFGFSQTEVKAKFRPGCGRGGYNIILTYTQDGGPEIRKIVDQVQCESDEFEYKKLYKIGTGPFGARGVVYAIVKVEAQSLCSGEDPGSAGGDQHSVHYWFNLGRTIGDVSAGQIRVDAESFSSTIYSPASLSTSLTLAAGVETVKTATGILRQVKAPQTLADIVVLDASSYEVRFYTPAQVGTQDPVTQIYAVSGTPLVVHKLENPDAAIPEMKRLRITETRGSLTKVSEFGYDSALATWTFNQGNGLRRESEVTTVVSGNTVRTLTVHNEADQVVSKVARTYHQFGWGEELIKEVLDPDGPALTTDYEFYEVASNDPHYRRLKQRTNPDGSWERFTYHASGRTLKTIRPFLNAPATTTDEALCRVTENSYDTIADVDGDAVAENRTTTIERTLGTETSRRYQIDWSKAVTLGSDACIRRSDIVCVAASAAWDAPANLVTETLRYASGAFAGRERRVVNPDSTATLTTYSLSSGVLTTTTKTGQPNAGLTDIVHGRRTVTFTSASGQLTSETVTDIASTLELSSWTATEFDSVNRPTRFDFTDGTYTTRSFACCGLASERDRTGIVTSYTYDALGNQITSTRSGITTSTTYDAEGRVKTVTRIGTDSSTQLQETNTYDLAGRLTSRKDALDRETLFAETYNNTTGHSTRTTTNPDGGTAIEVSARDGSRLSVGGTAAAPHSFEYGVETGNLFAKDIAHGVDSGGLPTSTEWTKTFTDFAGRTFKTVYADSATMQSFYNAAGQLDRQVDPDGVTTLFAYNARGEQEVIALDLNTNGTIDYAGTDRVTRTLNVVAAKSDGGTYTVQRTTTQVWETNGADTPTTVSITEQSSDGLRSWQTVRGLTSTSITVLDGSGGRTVTSTTPDGVKTVQVYSAGLLVSNTIKTAADLQIAGATYIYDAHHRLQSTTDARNGSTTLTYFGDDQLHTLTTPDPDATQSGTGYDPQTTTYAYNSAGRVQSVTQPDSAVVNTTYWFTGAVKRTWGARTYPVEYAYDPQGRMKTLTTWQNFAGDSGKAVTTWNYDLQRGWLLNKRYADSTGPGYTYKSSGRLETRTWARTPVITTTYSYNAGGDLSGTDYSDTTPDVTLVYDRSGRPSEITDASGARTLSYHASGQLENETYTSGVINGFAVNRTFDSSHRISGLAVPSVVSATFGYDPASRLQTVTRGTATATYAYAANSPLAEAVVFADSGATRLTTTKTYDKLNRLASVVNTPSAASAVSHAYTYNAANQRTRATRENSAYWNYAYDALGQVTTGSKFLGDGTPALGLAHTYSYDDIGNRQTATVNAQVSTYTPNALNQYIQRTVPGTLDVTGAATTAATVTVAMHSGTPQATTRQGETFYKQLTVDNSASAQNPALKIIGAKNLVGPAGEDAVTEIQQSAYVAKTPEVFIHDLDGNLTADARWSYTWDAENRLIAMETNSLASAIGVTKQKLEFAYDAQGRRFQKKVYAWNAGSSLWTLSSQLHFLYDGWNLLADLNGLAANATVCTYVWGLDLSGSARGAGGVGGLLFATFAGQTTNHAYAYDGNGNVSALFDLSTGIKSATYDYNAFGEIITSEGAASVVNAARFSTKYTDDETQLVYYGFRYYQPETGRWPNRDPIKERGGANLYGFVGNDAVNRRDSLGLYTLGDANDSLVARGVTPQHGVHVAETGYVYYGFSETQVFEEWLRLERSNTAWLKELPRCPKKLLCVDAKAKKAENPNSKIWENPMPANRYHKGALLEMRSRPTSGGHSNQCSYDADGNVMTGIPAGGTADYRAVSTIPVAHALHDVFPAFLAEKLNRMRDYYEVRPVIVE